MTNQTNWKEYTGSDEQIAELFAAPNGFIGNSPYSISKDPMVITNYDILDKIDAGWLRNHLETTGVTAYWIIPDDPLREMKIRQLQTGQPVWIRRYSEFYDTYEYLDTTTTPNWHIPNAEYSLTPFQE